jgi:hypothetical protein
MTTITNSTPSPVSFEVLLTKMLPHFRYYVGRKLRLRLDNFDDAVKELTAIAYEFYHSLVQRGKDVFYTPIMKFAIKRYREGRRFIGLNTTDVLSHQTQLLDRCATYSIDDCVEDTDKRHCIQDRQAKVFDTVQTRVDFSDWYQKQSIENQWLISDLALGETTNAVAKKYGVSASLISIKRRNFYNSWRRVLDPPTEEKGMLVPA